MRASTQQPILKIFDCDNFLNRWNVSSKKMFFFSKIYKYYFRKRKCLLIYWWLINFNIFEKCEVWRNGASYHHIWYIVLQKKRNLFIYYLLVWNIPGFEYKVVFIIQEKIIFIYDFEGCKLAKGKMLQSILYLSPLRTQWQSTENFLKCVLPLHNDPRCDKMVHYKLQRFWE